MSEMNEQLASRLRERVTIQTLSLESDGMGGGEEAWADFVTLFAEVIPIRAVAREQVMASQREARNAYLIIVRRHDVLDATMRVQWQGRALRIDALTHYRATTEMIVMEGSAL